MKRIKLPIGEFKRCMKRMRCKKIFIYNKSIKERICDS